MLEIDFKKEPPTQEDIDKFRETTASKIERVNRNRMWLHLIIVLGALYIGFEITKLLEQFFLDTLRIDAPAPSLVLGLLSFVLAGPVIFLGFTLINLHCPEVSCELRTAINELSAWDDYPSILKLMKRHTVSMNYIEALKNQNREITYFEYKNLDKYILRALATKKKEKHSVEIYGEEFIKNGVTNHQ